MLVVLIIPVVVIATTENQLCRSRTNENDRCWCCVLLFDGGCCGSGGGVRVGVCQCGRRLSHTDPALFMTDIHGSFLYSERSSDWKCLCMTYLPGKKKTRVILCSTLQRQRWLSRSADHSNRSADDKQVREKNTIVRTKPPITAPVSNILGHNGFEWVIMSVSVPLIVHINILKKV